ncbi:MAG: guanylate kinase [Flavobacteriales bacterium]
MSYNKAIIVSAPSGAGKTTIVHYLLSQIPELSFSISACSRNPRHNEKEGQDYYFYSPQEFKKRIEDHAFLEWEEVYDNMFYGTLKEEVERLWAMNKVIIFDVDVMGGLNLKQHFGQDALAIFISPPSLKVLEQRLRKRATDSEDVIKMRLAKAEEEMSYKSQFDLVIVNDDLNDTSENVFSHVNTFVSS